MSITNGDFIRVKKPKSDDGLSPRIVDGQVQYKYIDIPPSSKKSYELLNDKIPTSLKMSFEEVKGYVAPAGPTPEQLELIELKKKIAALEQEKTLLKSDVLGGVKTPTKPKENENA